MAFVTAIYVLVVGRSLSYDISAEGGLLQKVLLRRFPKLFCAKMFPVIAKATKNSIGRMIFIIKIAIVSFSIYRMTQITQTNLYNCLYHPCHLYQALHRIMDPVPV